MDDLSNDFVAGTACHHGRRLKGKVHRPVTDNDAAIGVFRRISGVDVDPLEALHVLQPEHSLVPVAEAGAVFLDQPAFFAKFDLIRAGGDAGFAVDLLFPVFILDREPGKLVVDTVSIHPFGRCIKHI